jgi:hypothetical protein
MTTTTAAERDSVMDVSWATVIPLFVLALGLSTTGWILAVRREESTASVLDVGAGLIAAGGALLIIGTGALGWAALAIAIPVTAVSVAVFRVAVSRSASRD